MELYTLDRNFRKKKPIDQPLSAVWTERYGKAGDVNLIVAPTTEMINALAEGTFLALKGTNEVMLLESALLENGVLKVTGNTLDFFLNQRIIKGVFAGAGTRWYGSTGLHRSIEDQLNSAVRALIVAGGELTNSDLGIDGAKQVIPNLTVDESGPKGENIDSIVFPIGNMYAAFEQAAATYSCGFQIYLESANPNGIYSLKFRAYHGVDHTTGSGNPLVRFSPNLESLTNISRLRSIAGYKNVAYVFPPDSLVSPPEGSSDTPLPATAGVAYSSANAPGENNFQAPAEAIGFDRRTIMDVASDVTYDSVGGSASTLLSVLTQKAKDLLANNNYVRVVDGEIIPQSEYQYGTHYKLGDIIELDDGDGTIQEARITEFIRSKDSGGEKAYPTVSVIT